jgi:dipeptide/tripeptide permease
MAHVKSRKGFQSFSALFWLVIIFEFFERGSYYGMMSVLSIYLTDILEFSKENVGLIKGTIQPILYFLPILSGAIADRFGFRKTLMIAFALMGGGYFLTAQVTGYTPVFLMLCVMALGAGTFKPIISGTIARVTSKEQSTIGFGIYYWSINLGAFLFPLFLIPYLKTVPSSPPWKWVMLAAAIGTGIMIIPTLLFYREPPKTGHDQKPAELNLIKTLANAFEIIYSPFILIFSMLRHAKLGRLIGLAAGLLSLLAIWLYLTRNHFFLFYVCLLFWMSQLILCSNHSGKRTGTAVILVGLFALLWILPGLSVYSRIISTVIGSTVLSLFIIQTREKQKFHDHFKFLLMIFIYSGFWVLYFQMYDSVLWYVKDYVDATTLNRFITGLLHKMGFSLQWAFDVEHVTVINAGTIILLQLLISNMVKNKRALPTMMVGMVMGILGMAILAIDPSIWVFMAGIVIFSIGEMTAHPKFISYVGQTAPKERMATYMGYIFLYGVIGSSIGAPLGAKLYVHFVDHLHQPRILWLIFCGIGLVTVIGLALFNRFLNPPAEGEAKTKESRTKNQDSR